MKKIIRNILLTGWIVLLASCGGNSNPGESILFEYVDPLEKIIPEASYFEPNEALSEVVRGEHATLQFVIRSKKNLENVRVSLTHPANEAGKMLDGGIPRFVGLVKVGRPQKTPPNDIIISPSGYYPDPVYTDSVMDIPFDRAQTIWLSIPIPTETSPGDYTGKVTLTGEIGGKTFSMDKSFVVKVYPPVVTESTLWVTNWFHDDFSRLNDGKPVERYSDQYWKYMAEMAGIMKAYHQNVIWASPVELANYTIENGKYTIDFTNFDKTIEFFIREGVIGRIEGRQIAGRRDGLWLAKELDMYVPVEKDGKIQVVPLPFSDQRTRSFYSQFLPALLAHLKEKGWDKQYMQHISDEPIDEHVKSYIEIASFVKKMAPDIKLVEACHSKNVDNLLDIWVPQLNYLQTDLDFYIDQAKKGKEVWLYICVFPQEEYANRFIQLPLLKGRLVHWLNYKYDIKGYLHWGFNHWVGDPMKETAVVQLPGGLVIPGGDSWIIYPYKGKVITSIRMDAMRDGLIDYELLRMLERKNPEKAKELSSKVVFSFKLYDTNVAEFRATRRELMKLLSE